MFNHFYVSAAVGVLLTLGPGLSNRWFSEKTGITRNAVRDAFIMHAEIWIAAMILLVIERYLLAPAREGLLFSLHGSAFMAAALIYAFLRKYPADFSAAVLILAWSFLGKTDAYHAVLTAGLSAFLFQLLLLGIRERLLLGSSSAGWRGLPVLLACSAVVSLVLLNFRLI